MPGPGGKVGHAELEIGNSLVMLADVMPDGSSPTPPADTTVSFYVLVEDVDAVFAKAIASGGTAISEPETMFYGDRTAIGADPSGHHWNIATHVEDVSPEEMERRMGALGAT
ncbi:MAG: VOC family protein [Dehalococcoidia bacterium]|nr:VOC family protein [Dehalococcoidia bacterium]